VETWPFLKRLLGTCLVFFVVPVQHIGLVFEVHTLAEPLQDTFGVVEEVVCINYTDLDTWFLGLGGIVAIGGAVGLLRVGIAVCVVCMTWSDLAYLSQVVEHPMNFVVSSLDWIEIVESGKLVEWRDGAAVIGWDARVRVTDQESKVKFGEHVGRDDGGVVGLCFGVIWCESVLTARACTIDVIDTIGDCAVRSDSALDALQRWCDACWLAAGRHQIVDDILDEDALTLMAGK
jgi:hypothetical protein